MKVRKRGYAVFLVLTIIFTLCAIWTLIPSEGASRACGLGYKAHCTITPYSTLICLALAALTCKLRKRFFTTQE
ncbi:hypothetical protein K8R78_04380 [bacterium]|nr:hypothetical protein [bacterium]